MRLEDRLPEPGGGGRLDARPGDRPSGHPELMIVRRGWHRVLTDGEVEIARQALAATVDGPFFEDWEFSSLFGLERDEVHAVLIRWRDELDPPHQFLAVDAALNNLIGYPHGVQGTSCATFFSAGLNDLEALSRKINRAALG